LEAGSVPPSLNFPQLDFVKPSSGFHPVIWERVMWAQLSLGYMTKQIYDKHKAIWWERVKA
jgi:hypothetical protein